MTLPPSPPAAGRPSPIVVNAILLGLMIGGSALAFRWATPAGNMTISRVFILVALIAAGSGFLRLSTVPTAARPALVASLAVLFLMVAGLLHSPAPATGLATTVNVGEALVTFFVSMLLVHNVIRRSRGPAVVSALARVPLWGYLPTGLLGGYQALQLLAGATPTIPLLQYARLDEGTLNSARTAFHGGLNELSLDRIAAAMGDPASYGIFSAAIVAYCLWAWRSRMVPGGLLFWVTILLGALGVVLSASPGAVLVLAVALACNVPRDVVGWARSLRGAAALLGAIVVLAKLVPQAQGFVLSAQERVTDAAAGQGTVDEHMDLLAVGWGLFQSHPFLGVGTGGLGFHQYGFDPGFSSVHNTLVLALAEGGVVLAVAMVVLWSTLWRRLVPAAILLPLTAAWLVYLDFNRIPALWVIGGVAAGLLSCMQRIRRLQAKDLSGGDGEPSERLVSSLPAPGPSGS